MMPTHYLYKCQKCGYERRRYRNIKNCPVCHSPLSRLYDAELTAVLTSAQKQILIELAAGNGLNWSEFCRKLADGGFWPIELKE